MALIDTYPKDLKPGEWIMRDQQLVQVARVEDYSPGTICIHVVDAPRIYVARFIRFAVSQP